MRNRGTTRGSLTASRTLDSLHDIVSERSLPKNSPSISSSGYGKINISFFTYKPYYDVTFLDSGIIDFLIFPLGSQAVSSTNLTSDDTLSIRSMSVDDTPDFESRYSHTHSNNDQHSTKSKYSVVGLKTDLIADLKNDVNTLRNEMNSKSELNEPFTSTATKKTPLTPGIRDRINPFLKEFDEEEGLFDKSNSAMNTTELNLRKSGNITNNSNEGDSDEKSKTWFDPLGCLPVKNQINTSSQNKTNSDFKGTQFDNMTNGQIVNDEDDAITSDQSNPEAHSEQKSNDVSSIGSAGDYDSPYEGTSVVKTQLPPGKVYDV